MHLLYSPDFWRGFALGLCIIAMSAVVIVLISRTMAKQAT